MPAALYILTRRDIPDGAKCVQSGHAVAQWMLENKNHKWQNNTLVYVTVPDKAFLQLWCWKLSSYGHAYSEWYEPDMDNERTSIACYSEDGKIFGGLPLMFA